MNHRIETLPTTLKTIALSAIALLTLAPSSHAVSFTWTAYDNTTSNATVNAAWTNGANWLTGAPIDNSDSSNELIFFDQSNGSLTYADGSTRLEQEGVLEITNVPSTFSLNSLLLQGRGPNNSNGTGIIIGDNTSTWTIGDGTTSSITLNTQSGGGGDRHPFYIVQPNITLNQATTTFSGNGGSTLRGLRFTGNIGEAAGGYGIDKSGSHLLILEGNNTYTGATTISGGTLRGALGTAIPSSNLTLSGGTLEVSGGGSFTRSLGTGSNQFQITGGNSGFSTIGADLNVTVDGNSATQLVWGSPNFNPSSSLILNQSTADSKLMLTNPIDLGSSTRRFAVNGNTAVVSGVLSGTGAIEKDGGGTLVLTGSNTYTGTNLLDGGKFSIETSDNAGAGGGLNFRGGTLQVRGTTLTALTGLGHPVSFNNGSTVGLDIDDKDNVFTADLAFTNGNAQFQKRGAGTLVLDQANTITNQSTATGGGTLVLDYSTQNNSKLADGQRLNSANTNIVLRGGSHAEVVTQLNLLPFAGNGDGGGSTNISRDGGTATIETGNIGFGSRSGRTLWVADNGIATTTRANNNKGILGGWAIVGSDFATNNGGNLEALTPGAYAAVTTAGINMGAVQGQLTGGGTLTGGITLNGLRISNSGNSNVLEAGSNNLRISQPNGEGGLIYAGGFDDNYTINGTGQITPQNGNQELNIYVHAGTLTLNIPVLNNGSSSAPLNKAGAGTLVFDADVTYNGSTYINGGTLLINGQHDGANGQINVLGGTLGGTGTINSNVFVFGGSSVAPGASPGTLTFASGGDLTLDGNSTSLQMEIEGTSTSSFDRIVGIDELQLGGDLVVDITGTYADNTTWDLLDFGSLNGDFDEVIVDGQSLSLSGSLWSNSSYTYQQTTGVLTFLGGGGGTLAGDYNDDGTVDLADYTIWRNNVGNTGTLPNDVDGGVIGTAQYNTWRGNFGATGPVSGVVATVPEPGTMVLAGLALIGLAAMRQSRS